MHRLLVSNEAVPTGYLWLHIIGLTWHTCQPENAPVDPFAKGVVSFVLLTIIAHDVLKKNAATPHDLMCSGFLKQIALRVRAHRFDHDSVKPRLSGSLCHPMKLQFEVGPATGHFT
ncbi:Uncharacterised protein [Burkholderia pseudomallei]|nr:Uncharacterised protein [Burkholderia pseudomallei]